MTDDSNPTPNAEAMAQQEAYQRQTDAIAHHMIGLCATTGVPPVMAALASTQMLTAVLTHLNKTDPETAKALLEDLARGVVGFIDQLAAEAA